MGGSACVRVHVHACVRVHTVFGRGRMVLLMTAARFLRDVLRKEAVL